MGPSIAVIEKVAGKNTLEEIFDMIPSVNDFDGNELRDKDKKFNELFEANTEFDERDTLMDLQHVVFTLREDFNTSLIVETADCLEAKQYTLY